MAIRYEEQEIRRSLERGAGDSWSVQDVERHENWIYFARQERRVYAPLEHLELPHLFGRTASDDDALMKFLKDYGRLGWREFELSDSVKEFVRPEDGPVDNVFAEPVEWIRAHAATVHWCLDGAEALRKPPRARLGHCHQLISKLPDSMGIRGEVERDAPALWRGAVKNLDPATAVAAVLADRLERNLTGVRRRIWVDPRTAIMQSVWKGSTLLESIYTLVADAATGGRLARCQARDCGAVFLQTDNRQRFCPPGENQDKSSCMNRERVRRQRPHARKGQAHGKKTRTR